MIPRGNCGSARASRIEIAMPEPGNSDPSLVSPEKVKKPVTVYTTSSSNTSRRNSTEDRHGSSPDKKKESNVESMISVSALGSNSAVPIPNDAEKMAQDSITEKISVLKLSDGFNIICMTETKGHLKQINEIARKNNAKAVIHTGDFGFYDKESWKHISIKELRHMIQFGTVPHGLKSKLGKIDDYELRKACEGVHFSDLELFLSGKEQLEVPVYAIWGNQEDVHVVKKFYDGTYQIPNLFLLNQDASYSIPAGNQIIRLFGIGGSFLYHKFFDIGHGTSIVSGADGAMWATLIQLGNLIELSERHNDPSEIRIFVCHVPPGKEGLVNQLATALKSDFTITGALHGKFCHAYTDFSVRSLANYLEHTSMPRMELPRLWKHVQDSVGRDRINDADFKAVGRVMEAVQKIPASEDELKHIWHLNLTDVKVGHIVLTLNSEGLSFCPVVEHTWNLHHARGGKVSRRKSSIGSRHPPHSIAERKEETVEQSVETECPLTLKIRGFPGQMTKEELIKAFALQYMNSESLTLKGDLLIMKFADESAFKRASTIIPTLKHSGSYLTCESSQPNPAADS